jgi:hypothetical protein
MQSVVALATSTYWPLQKTAPLGPWQSEVQLGGKVLAVQSAWQLMFACTWHEPEQLAVHWTVQSAEGDVALHWSWQRLLQSAAQSEAQPEPCPAQTVEHCASQSDLQAVEQEKLPGLAEHAVMQDALQLLVQETVGLALHWTSHAATRFGATH